MKKIGVTFVPSTRTRTLRNQRKGGLHVLLFDAFACTSATIITAADAGTTTAGSVLVLLVVPTMSSGSVTRGVREGISR